MTEEELNAIEARANAATAGPWRGTKNEGVQADDTAVFETGCGCCTEKFLSEPDALFIANARTDVPALVAEIRRIKQEMYQEALDDMRQLAAPLFAELEQRKEGAMIDEIKYENVVREFDYDSFTMGEEIVRLRKRLAAIEILHKQWVVKFLSGHGRSRGAQQIIDALTEILHKKEDA